MNNKAVGQLVCDDFNIERGETLLHFEEAVLHPVQRVRLQNDWRRCKALQTKITFHTAPKFSRKSHPHVTDPARFGCGQNHISPNLRYNGMNVWLPNHRTRNLLKSITTLNRNDNHWMEDLDLKFKLSRGNITTGLSRELCNCYVDVTV